MKSSILIIAVLLGMLFVPAIESRWGRRYYQGTRRVTFPIFGGRPAPAPGVAAAAAFLRNDRRRTLAAACVAAATAAQSVCLQNALTVTLACSTADLQARSLPNHHDDTEKTRRTYRYNKSQPNFILVKHCFLPNPISSESLSTDFIGTK
ncbi:uncharacterized protein LOC134717636 [Mytilus trossulus]|uniref:uncharacterized protein LOC134717636 n=1 Tax=Mytilus trossulus TaxID=6551 RepID=UPI0030058E44